MLVNRLEMSGAQPPFQEYWYSPPVPTPMSGTPTSEGHPAIENVQKFALRVCSKSWNTDHNSLLDTLNIISTLSARRTSLKLCLLFKMLTGRVDYPFCPFTHRHTPYANRHLNTAQLTVPHARTNQFKYSFFPSAMEQS